nr:hypothetical protein Iba_chr03dCG1370 [Ipomoea batatas]
MPKPPPQLLDKPRYGQNPSRLGCFVTRKEKSDIDSSRGNQFNVLADNHDLGESQDDSEKHREKNTAKNRGWATIQSQLQEGGATKKHGSKATVADCGEAGGGRGADLRTAEAGGCARGEARRLRRNGKGRS